MKSLIYFPVIILSFFLSPIALSSFGNSAIIELSSAKHQRILLVVAHQDDDAFIVSKLQNHIKECDSVFIVWTCKSYQGDSLYGDIRIEESKTAMKLLGLDSSSYRFLNYPDMDSYKYIDKIIYDLTKYIISFRPDIIYIQAYEMGNIDHDVAHFCTIQAVKKLKYSCEIFEFPQYSSFDLNGVLPFHLRAYPDSLKTLKRKLSDIETNFVIDYWKIYQSQKFPLMYYFYFLGELNELFSYEEIRNLPDYDYTKRPFDSDASYERYIPNIRFEDFQKSITEYFKEKERQ